MRVHSPERSLRRCWSRSGGRLRAVIIGHSERRQFFGETNETANRKVKAALAADLLPILCVGESLAEREAKSTDDRV